MRVFLANAQRIAHLGNWDWDLVTDKAYWSDEVYRIFGFAPQEYIPTYEAFLRSVHADDREYVRRSVINALYGGSSYDLEYRIVQPGGAVRVVHEQGEVVRDKAGRPIRMTGTVQDVTEQRRAGDALLQLASIVESSEDAIIGMALDGIIASWNRGAESEWAPSRPCGSARVAAGSTC